MGAARRPGRRPDAVRDRLLAGLRQATVVVDPSGALVHQVGDASPYVRLDGAGGDFTVGDMVVPELRGAVAAALARVARGEPSPPGAPIAVGHERDPAAVRVSATAVEVPGVTGGYVAVTFHPVVEAPSGEPDAGPGPDALAVLRERCRLLERELAGAEERVQVVTEELEATQEELRATDQELRAVGEALEAAHSLLGSGATGRVGSG